ncbi:MAG: hypothetical protein ACJ8KU_10245 [Chthoniobacterales bacterium]
MNEILAELKRRHVYRVAAAYAVVAWLLVQAASIVFPAFELPTWAMKVLIVSIVLGFPAAIALAWAFDITPKGIRRTGAATPQLAGPRRLLLALELGGVVLLVGVVAISLWHYVERTISTSSRASGAVAEKSIAVLPFENRSRDPENAFFADGVQDEILTDLAKVADLKVISRTSVMQYKTGAARNLRKIADELGVAHVVEGSVQRADKRVRVNVQLIDARSDTHLWAQTYDRDLSDVFAIQSEVAQTVATQLSAKLSPDEKAAIQQPPTGDIVAFDEYSRAKTLVLISGFSASLEKNYREAIALLDQAVTRDPSFHAAYCQLVLAHDSLYALGYDHTPARLQAAASALSRAEALRPDSGETHLTRAWHLYYGPRDYGNAMGELKRARQTLVNDPRIYELTGYILRRRGEQEEGLANLEHAVQLDPRNTYTLTQIALSYGFLRRYGNRGAVLDRALSIVPEDAAMRCERAQVDLEWKANPKPLHDALENVRSAHADLLADTADSAYLCAMVERDWSAADQVVRSLGENPLWVDGVIVIRGRLPEGLLARAMGDEARARSAFTTARAEQQAAVNKQQGYAPAVCLLGFIDAALGNREAALQEAQRAVDLLPESNDSINSQRMQAYFAVIAAWTGDKDVAVGQLERVLPKPGAAFLTSYGLLKLHPIWDPLRGDPRFERIVGSLAPK